jgi:RNA polymerase sigma factor (sigma-70 family)
VRRYGDFDTAEDAVQEALFAAATRWPRDGLPEEPRGWLVQTASRRLIDQWRSDRSRRDREELVSQQERPAQEVSGEDDTLTVLFMCCHPALTPASAIALTLRAVGGLTTAQVASAFLVPEATMAQRISRAKATIKASGVPFAMPSGDEELGRWIERHSPDIVLCGHVHQSPFETPGGWIDRIGTTVVVNAGTQPGPEPTRIEVDTDADIASWWSYLGVDEQALAG